MKLEIIPVSRAVAAAVEEPYAYIRRLSSRVEVGPAPAVFLAEDVEEARFFGPRREIRFYREDGRLCSAALEDEQTDVFLDAVSRLRDPGFGRSLTMRQYITYDEDGQGRIRDIRLVHWEACTDEPTQ